jgi:hypothetical protein
VARLADTSSQRKSVSRAAACAPEKRPEEGVRRTRHQHQDAEQRKRDGDAARAHTGNPDRIGEGADQVDHEGQATKEEQLLVHDWPFRLAEVAAMLP